MTWVGRFMRTVPGIVLLAGAALVLSVAKSELTIDGPSGTVCETVYFGTPMAPRPSASHKIDVGPRERRIRIPWRACAIQANFRRTGPDSSTWPDAVFGLCGKSQAVGLMPAPGDGILSCTLSARTHPRFFLPMVLRYLASLLLAAAFIFWILKLNRRIPILLVGGFLMLTALPSLRVDRRDVDWTENRTLNRFPRLCEIGTRGLSAWCRNFAAAYEDRFFLRRRMLRVYQCLFRVFRPQGNEVVAIGGNGWLYLRQTLRGESAGFTEDEMKSIAAYLESVDNFLRARGKRFIFLVAPDKVNVVNCGSFWTPVLASCGNADALVAHLRRHCRFPVVYARETLSRLQGDAACGDMYYKSDTHWTPEGAWFGGYLPLMDVLSDRPRCRLTGWRSEIFENGDLTRLLGDPRHENEQQTVRRPTVESRPYETLPQETVGELRTWCPSGKGRLLCYRDSFMEYVIPHLAPSFAECRFIWPMVAKREVRGVLPDDRADVEACDVLLIEVLERLLPELLKCKPIEWR